jgi:hypothetical protein
MLRKGNGIMQMSDTFVNCQEASSFSIELVTLVKVNLQSFKLFAGSHQLCQDGSMTDNNSFYKIFCCKVFSCSYHITQT